MSNSLQPHGLYTVHGILQTRRLEWVAFPSPGDLPNPGIESRSPALQADSLPVEPQGKPSNTGVGSLSLLQQIFPTQESNQDLLHCRQVCYQLSYEIKRHQTQIAYSKAETLLCQQRFVQSKLWFFLWSCMDVRVGL